jgi:hypothetical protein
MLWRSEEGGCSLTGWRSQRGSKLGNKIVVLDEKFIYCASVLNYLVEEEEIQ